MPVREEGRCKGRVGTGHGDLFYASRLGGKLVASLGTGGNKQ